MLYGSTIGGQAQQQAYPDTPQVERQPGLHEALSQVWMRINQVNDALDKTLQRIHGPRPQPTSNNAKNPETPTIVQIAGSLGQEILRLESLTHDLIGFIG